MAARDWIALASLLLSAGVVVATAVWGISRLRSSLHDVRSEIAAAVAAVDSATKVAISEIKGTTQLLSERIMTLSDRVSDLKVSMEHLFSRSNRHEKRQAISESHIEDLRRRVSLLEGHGKKGGGSS